MDCGYITDRLEELSPRSYAEKWDNVGLLVGRYDKEVNTVYIALDATDEVIDAAIECEADMIITHHPLIFSALKGVRADDYIGRRILKLARYDISYYAMHTNFDHAEGGINDTLAETLKLKNCVRMDATPNSLGVVGDVSISFGEMAKILGCGFRVWGDITNVKRIAVAGGAAFDWDLIYEAQNLGAEAYLASELKYSMAIESPIPLIEATHYALEAPGMRALAKRERWTFIEDIPQTTIIE